MFDYLNISTFFIGFSTAFFSIFAIHILCFRRCRTRYQTILGIVIAVWAVSNIKDLVITFPGFYTERVLNWIMIIDGWSALTYTILVLEVVMPGWTTMKRLLLLSMRFSEARSGQRARTCTEWYVEMLLRRCQRGALLLGVRFSETRGGACCSCCK